MSSPRQKKNKAGGWIALGVGGILLLFLLLKGTGSSVPGTIPDDDDDDDDDDIIPSVTKYKISGTVQTLYGEPVSNVNISIGGAHAKTTYGGQYYISLPKDSSGFITPSKLNYTFNPETRSFQFLSHDLPNQNFTAYTDETVNPGDDTASAYNNIIEPEYGDVFKVGI